MLPHAEGPLRAACRPSLSAPHPLFALLPLPALRIQRDAQDGVVPLVRLEVAG